MNPDQVTEDWLARQHYFLQSLNNVTIEDVVFKPLKPILDGRGDVIELWSEPWSGFTPPAHVYQSATDYGVVKCWHLHKIHTDQFTVTRGKIQVALVDIRPSSPSFGHVNTFIMGESYPGLLRIPPGLLHGWKCLSIPEVIVVNLQSHVYDPQDEYKFAWDSVLKEVWQPKNG